MGFQLKALHKGIGYQRYVSQAATHGFYRLCVGNPVTLTPLKKIDVGVDLSGHPACQGHARGVIAQHFVRYLNGVIRLVAEGRIRGPVVYAPDEALFHQAIDLSLASLEQRASRPRGCQRLRCVSCHQGRFHIQAGLASHQWPRYYND